MIRTKHANWTDAELLQLVTAARIHSPIIEELAARLEKYAGNDSNQVLKIECPACESHLKIEFDPMQDTITNVEAL